MVGLLSRLRVTIFCSRVQAGCREAGPAVAAEMKFRPFVGGNQRFSGMIGHQVQISSADAWLLQHGYQVILIPVGINSDDDL